MTADHLPRCQLRTVKGSFDRGVKNRVPLEDADVGKQSDVGDRCVVDQHIHPAKCPVGLFKQLFDLSMVTDVGCHGNRRTGTDRVIFCRRLTDTLRMAGIEDNIVPLLPEQTGGLFTDAAA